mmetsp:Transcript_128731/g.372522  ORF Transcript_128731/g.372522 Transcript_128731/m.372522 type:complete len:234 (-) Transcript_128731:167-868(-)
MWKLVGGSRILERAQRQVAQEVRQDPDDHHQQEDIQRKAGEHGSGRGETTDCEHDVGFHEQAWPVFHGQSVHGRGKPIIEEGERHGHVEKDACHNPLVPTARLRRAAMEEKGCPKRHQQVHDQVGTLHPHLLAVRCERQQKEEEGDGRERKHHTSAMLRHPLSARDLIGRLHLHVGELSEAVVLIHRVAGLVEHCDRVAAAKHIHHQPTRHVLPNLSLPSPGAAGEKNPQACE